MKAYLDILDNIISNCKDIRNNRTGTPDIGLSHGAVFEHDMSKGFPLLTTKKMGLKNIATEPASQKRGYGKALLDYLEKRYRGQYEILQVGTGECPSTLGFYEACGFTRSHRVERFFIDYYDHPIYEDGKQLVDMIYLRKKL